MFRAGGGFIGPGRNRAGAAAAAERAVLKTGQPRRHPPNDRATQKRSRQRVNPKGQPLVLVSAKECAMFARLSQFRPVTGLRLAAVLFAGMLAVGVVGGCAKAPKSFAVPLEYKPSNNSGNP